MKKRDCLTRCPQSTPRCSSVMICTGLMGDSNRVVGAPEAEVSGELVFKRRPLDSDCAAADSAMDRSRTRRMSPTRVRSEVAMAGFDCSRTLRLKRAIDLLYGKLA